jgi:chromosome segregation ATPase
MADPTRYEQYRQKRLPELVEALGNTSIESSEGKNTVNFLQSLISVRTAEMVTAQLAGTAESIGRSANSIKDALDHATDAAKASLENSSQSLIAALKANTEKISDSAKDIENKVATLSNALSRASTDIQNAGNQSAQAARKLNKLTLLLGIGTLLLFAVACVQAWETKRQVDLADRQFQRAEKQMQRKGSDTVQTPSQQPKQ